MREKMRGWRVSLFIAALSLASVSASAQKTAVSTNAADWGWFLTPNITAQYALARHWTVLGAVKYNDWTWHDGNMQMRNRQARRELKAGARFWPWYTYSGWWAGAGIEYREYSSRPFDDILTKEEGDAVGLALSGGYSLSLNSWFNLDFGIGVLAGKKYYRTYVSDSSACPECGRRSDPEAASDRPSTALFFLPDELTIGAMIIF